MPRPVSGSLLKRQIFFWMAFLAGFIAFLYVFSSILLPFLAGMAIAYFLDPVADKALLMSIYVALGISHAIPATLAILVVSRDVMILGGVIIAWLFDKPLEIRPLYVSKVNTTAQIAFAAAVLGARAFGLSTEYWFWPAAYIVAALTLASAGAYLGPWIRHMGH